ncbi:hypothetical protein M427DRAFT_44477 [Gonapodya prolifera JEL478]|uniref:Uncharacterized protein n=1 Tax=Gonapodya prolifera (strain JEL478) TaxID=1344416 RepID=A0A139AF58_GONPJ|nr:hypothetical protein M427DRAFT_44477 [Gonapodya prolifera JEL478]|eukprot:KXS15390.1 hypothetical protein M427DRAFT_44477 [Gonapodya prolifera JEL478]
MPTESLWKACAPTPQYLEELLARTTVIEAALLEGEKTESCKLLLWMQDRKDRVCGRTALEHEMFATYNWRLPQSEAETYGIPEEPLPMLSKCRQAFDQEQLFVEDGFRVLADNLQNLAFLKSMLGSVTAVAEFFWALHRDSYIYASCVKEWYCFESPCWRKAEEPVLLEGIQELQTHYSLLLATYKQTQSVQAKRHKMKKIQDLLVNKIEDPVCKQKVVTKLCSFYNKGGNEFLLWLNLNPDFLAFSNCVYELPSGMCCEGWLEDHVATNVLYEYNQARMYHDEGKIAEIQHFFIQVFQTEDLVHYILKFFASCLHGKQKDQLIYFGLRVEGANRKGITMKLMEATFGKMAHATRAEFLCGPVPHPNKPTLELNALTSCDCLVYKSENFIFPKDHTLEERVVTLEYQSEDLQNVPEAVQQETEAYSEINDPFARFIAEQMRRCHSISCGVSANDVLHQFKEWVKKNKIPLLPQFSKDDALRTKFDSLLLSEGKWQQRDDGAKAHNVRRYGPEQKSGYGGWEIRP